FGYPVIGFQRPDFYEILRKRVPVERIYFMKKVLKTEEKEGKVIIHCSDNTAFSGDIVIGADGAYSGVRQSMYKELKNKGLLPETDHQGFSIGYTIIVGVAKGDPGKHPLLEDTRNQFSQVLFTGNSNCYMVTLPNNDICWGLGTQLSHEESENLLFRSSGWGSDSSESFIKEYRTFPSPVGGTMGDIFDATPKEYISKVYLEEKIFKTWYYGRTVLIGDGASNALHDAVVLANCLYAMKDNSKQSIHTAFKSYFDQRYIYAEASYKQSSAMSNLFNGQKFWQRMIRKLALNYVPTGVFDHSMLKITSHRPQIAWLPAVKNRGKVKINPQEFDKTSQLNAATI
ncbi:hypothetical protein BGZ76_003750, partial [Entomortierella beljakovae]